MADAREPAAQQPRDACLDLIADFNATGTPSTYVGTLATGAPSGRDFTCKWKHDVPPYDPDESVNAAHSHYTCPSNGSAFTLHNSGLAEDFRCKCNTSSCSSPSPPTPEVSSRCTQRKNFSTRRVPDPSVPDPVHASNQNIALAQSSDPRFYAEYTTIKDELAATEGCDFAPSDFAPMTSNINIGFLCGFRAGDEAAANNMVGLNATPAGYVWHHGLDMGSMQLVTKTAHNACGAHIGGVAVWKEALGIIDYPLNLPPLL